MFVRQRGIMGRFKAEKFMCRVKIKRKSPKSKIQPPGGHRKNVKRSEFMSQPCLPITLPVVYHLIFASKNYRE